MKKLYLLAAVAAIAIIWTLASAKGPANDPLTVGPDVYKLVFENDQVRLLEVTFKAGAKIAPHWHPDHAAYVLEAGELTITPEGKEAQVFKAEVGKAFFIPSETHSAVNTGKTTVRALVIELKKSVPAAQEKKS